MSAKLPGDIEAALERGDVVMEEPPSTARTPSEWVRENLFGTRANGVLTVVTTVIVAWALFALLRWFLVTADWRVMQANLRNYMIGRFPFEKVWVLWLSIYFTVLLAGAWWGFSGRRLRWTPAWTVARVLLTGLGVLVLLYLLDSAGVWVRMGIATGLYFAAIAAGRAWPERLRKPVFIGWIAWFPAVIILVRVVAGVPPNLWSGFFLNVITAVVGIFASFPIGVLLALGRRGTLPVISRFCVLVIEFVRGVPLITLLLFGNFVLPLMLPEFLELSKIMRAMLMFTLFSSAYVAEIVRGGLQGVDEGQYEAGRAVGLSTTRIMGFIALPQALRNTIPAMISHFISMFKDTTLLAILGFIDALRAALQAARPGTPFSGHSTEALIAVAFLFWVGAYSMGRASQRLERRLGVGER